MATKTGLILLAAGASRRMGRVKQLLPIDGEPALALCIRRILAGSISDVVVVIGNNRASILPVLKDLPVIAAINHDPGSQMAESVQVGLAALPSDVTGIIVALADHPLVAAGTYELLHQRHARYPSRILIPTFQGQGGHPTLFPASLCPRTDKPEPLNRIIQKHRDRIIRLAVDDPGVAMDMDYPADYEKMLSLAARQQQINSKGGVR